MRRRSIYWTFLLGYVIYGVFAYLAIAFFMPQVLTRYFEKKQALALYREAVTIADTYASGLYTGDATLESVKSQLDTFSAFTSAEIWILNPSGRMVLNSSMEMDVDDVIIVEGFDTSALAGNYYTTGTFFDYFDEEQLSVLASITTDDTYQINGYVVIHYPYSNIVQSYNDIQGFMFLMFAILLALSLIILLFFTAFVYIPLRRITTATEQYASGNYHYDLQPESNDELGYLAGILSYMAGEIAHSEDNQKQFVANVSHDFRSPLTSIQGYLQAMLDGTIPPELHEKYIQIVLNETQRLTKLTNSLLQLNNLNTKGMMLNRTDFDINTVIRSVAATFEGRCRDKNIRLQLILTGDELYVNADMEKIQQVLYNLLDNAIKFSHQNSRIQIEATEKKNKLYVSVKDYGIGIPKEELSLVWERFYKSDNSRGKDKKGTGLGLSITKEIIRSHGEHINVISTLGAGTEFVFTLPVSQEED
ncbi:MAG: HAMP domain-containing histidine kinase [Lachnospiraceae bacterium]|nr:HAMP domain-containing histidine kinase [Lachnospiraceae bacterium]